MISVWCSIAATCLKLAVLSNEGKLIATYPLRLGADRKLDAIPLGKFMLDHKLPTRDAELMLSGGLATASAEQKRVFLIMSASWCGPCRMLARFLYANKAELGRHYVFVKLDVSRDTHAQTLLDRYEGKDAANGVPWYVILDRTGKPLVTSNAKETQDYGSSNIGFPSSKEGIDHFLSILRQTAPGLSEPVLKTLPPEAGADAMSPGARHRESRSLDDLRGDSPHPGITIMKTWFERSRAISLLVLTVLVILGGSGLAGEPPETAPRPAGLLFQGRTVRPVRLGRRQHGSHSESDRRVPESRRRHRRASRGRLPRCRDTENDCEPRLAARPGPSRDVAALRQRRRRLHRGR